MVQEALGIAWEATNGICAKRLVPFLPKLISSLERHGHLDLDDETRTQLPSACGLVAEVAADGTAIVTQGVLPEPGVRRPYHRSAKPPVPRTWRTRADPFEDVWDEIRARLESSPELTAKALLKGLQLNYPGQFGHGQLRTLQRRVSEWRRQALLLFSDPWIEEERLADAVLPAPLSARVTLPAALPVLSSDADFA